MAEEPIQRLLKTTPFFQALDSESLAVLSESITVRHYEPEQVVFLEDTPFAGLHFVESGVGKLYSVSDKGREYVLTTLRSGDSCNEVPLIDGGPNPISFAAVEAMTVYVVSKETIEQICQMNPSLYQLIAQNMAVRCRQLVRQVCRLSLLSVTGRLAAFLLTHSNGSNVIELSWTQEELAARLGTVREVVSRALRELQQSEAIATDRQQIEILNRKQLEMLAE